MTERYFINRLKHWALSSIPKVQLQHRVFWFWIWYDKNIILEWISEQHRTISKQKITSCPQLCACMYGAYAVNWQKIPNSLCGCTFRSINVGTSSWSDRSKKTSLKGNDLARKESEVLSSITDCESKVNSIYQKKQKQIEVWVCGILVIFGLILLCYSSSHSFKDSLVWIQGTR